VEQRDTFHEGEMPDDEQISAVSQIAQKHQALFVKNGTKHCKEVGTRFAAHYQIAQFLLKRRSNLVNHFYEVHISTQFTSSEEELFQHLSGKTRYNVNVASKKVSRFMRTPQKKVLNST
jgi:hypothetical protein